MSSMVDPANNTDVRRRSRAVVLPREHGAWGLLLIPLFTGVVAGLRSRNDVLPLLLFTLSAICLFWLRTPVESLLGTAPVVARTSQERRTALLASVMLGAFSVGCLAVLMWGGRNLKLLLFGAAAAAAFFAQTALRRYGRETRMTAQLVGAAGLTAVAAAAYYVGTGLLDRRGLVLWVANLLFAWNQIHFVQVRIHSARATTFRDKLSRGKGFLIAQVLLLVALVGSSLLRLISLFVDIAFLPVLVRGITWFVTRRSGPLDVKKLGWSEMRQGVAFALLLAIAFLFR